MSQAILIKLTHSDPQNPEKRELDKSFAGVYMRWGAYTVSALSNIQSIIHHVCMICNNDDEMRLALIDWAENNTTVGNRMDVDSKLLVAMDAAKNSNELASNILKDYGGVCADELDKAKKLYPDHVFNEDMNDCGGLVFLSQERVDSVDGDSCAIACLNVDRHEVSCGVYDYRGNREEYEKEWAEDIKDGVCPEYDKIAIIGIDVENFKFSSIDKVLAFCRYSPDFWKYDGYVYGKIE